MSALGLVLAVTPSPAPTTVATTSGGSPGFVGFVVTFALALAAAGLFLSLTKHLRRVDRRARELPDEDAGVVAEGAGDAGAADDAGDAGTGVDGPVR